MELNRDARIACPWCQETSTVGETDDESFAQCRNREMRREYTHMMNSKSMRADTQVYFKCPKCGRWAQGNQFILIDKTEPWMKNLGSCSLATMQSKR